MMDGNGIVSKEEATCIKWKIATDLNASCLVCQVPSAKPTTTATWLVYIFLDFSYLPLPPYLFIYLFIYLLM